MRHGEGPTSDFGNPSRHDDDQPLPDGNVLPNWCRDAVKRSCCSRVMIGKVVSPPAPQRVRGGGRARLRLVSFDVHHRDEPARVIVGNPDAPPKVRVLARCEGRGPGSRLEPRYDEHTVGVDDNRRASKLYSLPGGIKLGGCWGLQQERVGQNAARDFALSPPVIGQLYDSPPPRA